MINQDVVRGKWNEIKGEFRRHFGDLTNDEVERTKGNVSEMVGLLQQRYGYAKDEAEKKLSRFVSEFDGAMDQAKRKMREGIDEVKNRESDSKPGPDAGERMQRH